MQAPTIPELLQVAIVLQALEQAWTDSLPQDPPQRHEEGGWVYLNTTSGTISIQRASAGSQAMLDLSNPPVMPDAFVVATFHTHPNPSSEGWQPGPSAEDTASACLLGRAMLDSCR
jgi:hypothetical protein